MQPKHPENTAKRTSQYQAEHAHSWLRCGINDDDSVEKRCWAMNLLWVSPESFYPTVNILARKNEECTQRMQRCQLFKRSVNPKLLSVEMQSHEYYFWPDVTVPRGGAMSTLPYLNIHTLRRHVRDLWSGGALGSGAVGGESVGRCGPLDCEARGRPRGLEARSYLVRLNTRRDDWRWRCSWYSRRRLRLTKSNGLGIAVLLKKSESQRLWQLRLSHEFVLKVNHTFTHKA